MHRDVAGNTADTGVLAAASPDVALKHGQVRWMPDSKASIMSFHFVASLLK
jgi:hypothetical protein